MLQNRTRITSKFALGDGVRSDGEFLGYTHNNGGTAFHPTSTCKIGIDPMALVDPQLRVSKLPSLRVADASVMPAMTSGNTNATSTMTREKCADMVARHRSPGGESHLRSTA